MALTRVKQLVILTAALTAPLSIKASAGDWTIIPGRSIGRTSLGQSRAAVLRYLGPPTETSQGSGGLKDDTWFAKVPGTDFVTVSYHADRVVQITTDNERFKTRDGLSVASKVSQVSRRFKHLRRFTYRDRASLLRTHTRLYDRALGIAFISTNNAVSFDAITVYQPGHRLVADVE